MPEGFDPYHKWLGIRPKDQPPNHYRLLGIELFENDPDVIASAADQRMAHVRSFQTGKNSEVSQKILNEIAAARVCLLDGRKKEQYDLALQGRIFSAPPKPQLIPGDEYSLATDSAEPEVPPPAAFEEAPILFTPERRAVIVPRPRRLFSSNFTVFIVLFFLIVSVVFLGTLLRQKSPPAKENNPAPAPASPSPKPSSTPSSTPSMKPSSPAVQPAPALKPQPEISLRPFPPKKGSQTKGNESQGNESKSGGSSGSPAPPVGSRPEPQSDVPKTPAPPSPRPAPESFTISLPNGKEFDSRIFDVDVRAVHDALRLKTFPRGQVLAVRPNNRYDAVLAGITRGKLHGEVLAFYSNQKVMTYSIYKDGHRDGILKTWLLNGQRCFWGQYSGGAQNGFSCFFTDDAPCLLIESIINKVSAVHLLRNLRVAKSFSSLEDALADPLAADRVKACQEVVSEMAKNELEFREMIKKELVRLRGKR
jgi:hypothetical protein